MTDARRDAHVGATWTVLGAGAILPRPGYGCSGYALRPAPGAPLTLFDCGPGTLRSLAEAGLVLADVRRVVLSHFHPDHCLDVLALAFARKNPGFEAPPLELIGPTGLVDWLERAAKLYGDRGWLRFDDTEVREVDPGAQGSLELSDMRLSWVATRHTPNALAWRADLSAASGTVSLAYTGDSGENPDVAALARGVDLFVCECSFADEHATEHHLSPSSAARMALAARARRLLLTHFYPGLDPGAAREVAARTFPGPIELAADRSVHELGPSMEARPRT